MLPCSFHTFQRGYVLVPARKLEELNRIETLLENEKAVLRAKGVQAIASGSTELSARGKRLNFQQYVVFHAAAVAPLSQNPNINYHIVPTEDLWLGVEEVCHCKMLFAFRHFNRCAIEIVQ